MKAGELANRFSVNVNTVRHYVRSGLLSPDKDASGYHYFSVEEERQLAFILRARELGFTLEDIRQLLSDATSGESPCPHARELIELRLTEARQKLNSMQSLVSRMESAVREWQALPDCAPCGDHICHLIEGGHHE
jgi:DNA-binding transcriptional MerR regulator